jgi:hypothetical protein
MTADTFRPATWLAYEAITTPMAAGLVVHVGDVAHVRCPASSMPFLDDHFGGPVGVSDVL